MRALSAASSPQPLSPAGRPLAAAAKVGNFHRIRNPRGSIDRRRTIYVRLRRHGTGGCDAARVSRHKTVDLFSPSRQRVINAHLIGPDLAGMGSRPYPNGARQEDASNRHRDRDGNSMCRSRSLSPLTSATWSGYAALPPAVIRTASQMRHSNRRCPDRQWEEIGQAPAVAFPSFRGARCRSPRDRARAHHLAGFWNRAVGRTEERSTGDAPALNAKIYARPVARCIRLQPFADLNTQCADNNEFQDKVQARDADPSRSSREKCSVRSSGYPIIHDVGSKRRKRHHRHSGH